MERGVLVIRQGAHENGLFLEIVKQKIVKKTFHQRPLTFRELF